MNLTSNRVSLLFKLPVGKTSFLATPPTGEALVARRTRVVICIGDDIHLSARLTLTHQVRSYGLLDN
jgi:hypothetical protein